jgi:hypothetical protein
MSRETATRLERQLTDPRKSHPDRIKELEGKVRSSSEELELARIRLELAAEPLCSAANEKAIVEQQKRKSIRDRIKELEGKVLSAAEKSELARIRIEYSGAPQFYAANEKAIVEQLKRGGVFNMKGHRALSPPMVVALLMIDHVERLRQRHCLGSDRPRVRKYWIFHYIRKRPLKFPRPNSDIWQSLVAEYMDRFFAPRSMRIKALKKMAGHDRNNPWEVGDVSNLSVTEQCGLGDTVRRLNVEAAAPGYVERRIHLLFPDIPREVKSMAGITDVSDPDTLEYDGELPPLPPTSRVSDNRSVAVYIKSTLASASKSNRSAYSSFRDKVLRIVAQLARVKCSSAKIITR